MNGDPGRSRAGPDIHQTVLSHSIYVLGNVIPVIIQAIPAAPIPEPGAFAKMLVVLGVLGGAAKRWKSRLHAVARRRESREGIDDENVANPCPCLHILAVEHSATGCARRLHDQRIPE